MEKKNFEYLRKDVRELNKSEKWGFACESRNCLLGAEFGLRCDDRSGVSDVRCFYHSVELKWIKGI